MKIKYILPVLTLTILTACKKDRLCSCVSSTHEETLRFYGTKKKSGQSCKNYANELDGQYPDVSCKLVE